MCEKISNTCLVVMLVCATAIMVGFTIKIMSVMIGG